MGLIQPIVRLTCSPGVFRNPHPSADKTFQFVVQNDLVGDWLITDNKTTFFRRKIIPGKRPLFDDTLFAYLNEPVDQQMVDDLIDATKKGKPVDLTMEVNVHFKAFSKRMLDYLTREKADEFNLADPEPPDADEIAGKGKTPGTFKEGPRGSGVDFIYVDAAQRIHDVPCHLSAFKTGPQYDLTFNLDTEKLTDLARLNVMRVLIAADHSRLLAQGAAGAKGEVRKRLKVWSTNLAVFLFNFLDFDRAGSLFESLLTRAQANFPKTSLPDFILGVRDDIDKKMITANHWAEARENEPGEEFQQKMARVFGSIRQTKPFASPVLTLRQMEDFMARALQANKAKAGQPTTLTSDDLLNILVDKVKFVLQFGLGHCQEHGDVSFVTLRTLMVRNAKILAALDTIILGGNANSDHEFVVGGIRPDQTEEATVSFPDNPRRAQGGSISVFDVKRLLDRNPGKTGVVCDPYLSKTVIKVDMAKMLDRINAPSRGRRKTTFLAVDRVHPEKPGIAVLFGGPHKVEGI